MIYHARRNFIKARDKMAAGAVYFLGICEHHREISAKFSNSTSTLIFSFEARLSSDCRSLIPPWIYSRFRQFLYRVRRLQGRITASLFLFQRSNIFSLWEIVSPNPRTPSRPKIERDIEEAPRRHCNLSRWRLIS